MTQAPQRQHAGTVSLAEIRAMLDDAAAHHYGPQHPDAPAVLGIYADPGTVEPARLNHRGVPVSVVPCVSALAVREALLTRTPGEWLVVVTDRPEEDLGAGILAHLVGYKLRTPDPWGAVRQQFAATGVEPALYAGPDGWALAHGLLAARPEAGWPPAPAGALTRDHALGAVARERLGLRPRSLDALGVLEWTARPGVTGRVADLRAVAGAELTDATLQWICTGAGAAAGLLGELVRRGDLKDTLPLALVLGLLGGADDGALGVARLAHRWGGHTPAADLLAGLGEAAVSTVAAMLRDPRERSHARALLTRADELLADAGAEHLAAASDVLPSGLTARLRQLAAQLRAAVAGGPAAAEAAWTAVQRHLLAEHGEDVRLAPTHAAVRLVRWLGTVAGKGGPAAGSRPTAESSPADGSLAALALRQSAEDAWVDAAVNDAYAGAADPVLAEALTDVLAAVRRVRDAHDREFAAALAAATRDELGTDVGYLEADGERVWLIEHVLPKVVVQLARRTPVLLLVLDGMSTAVATEVVDDVLARGEGWTEALLPDARRRGAALAALPSLTEVSRASLLCGRLTTGNQSREQQGYAALIGSYSLGPSSLFHKKPLDTSRPGFAVADDVAAAIAHPEQRLVTCVLNTIDDALDRSDPAGTTWTADAVKHLRPLLDRALAAGRTVVLTADHGHVVERREGAQRSHPDISSSRSRAAATPPNEDEVLVSGSRVLEHGGSAVLPASERLRYGPLKAGYHGGATPAEVVVPLVVVMPGTEPPAGSSLQPAAPQHPRWWNGPQGAAPVAVEVEVPQPEPRSSRRRPPAQEGLFEESLLESPPPTAGRRHTRQVALGEAVLASAAFAAQRELAGRVALTDEQVRLAVEALAAAPSTRLPGATLAGVLGVPATHVRGAVAQLQTLLNVEGYPVVRTEGPVVILDEPLLREQFGIR